MLKSGAFRDKPEIYQEKCKRSYPTEGSTVHVDHIIDLNSVSECFSEAFKRCSLIKCLSVRTMFVYMYSMSLYDSTILLDVGHVPPNSDFKWRIQPLQSKRNIEHR